MWLRNSRNQFIRSRFVHAGQNWEGEEYEEEWYLCANESWIDGMKWTDGVELCAPDGVCHGPIMRGAARVRLDGKLKMESLNLSSQPSILVHCPQ